jgi:hypothetical protein
MKIIKKIILLLLTFAAIDNANAQSSNLKTDRIKILGNCEMCKSKIEKAGLKKGMAKVQWDDKSKIATITYDSAKQTGDEILKRIALAGYDNEKFLAPDEAYAKLPECCKYQRSLKKSKISNVTDKSNGNDQTKIEIDETSSLQAIFSSYFDLKDAFIQSDVKSISNKAADLVRKIASIDRAKLTEDQLNVWMKVNQHLIEMGTEISKSDKIDKQRIKFSDLSKDFYQLAKVAHFDYEIYFQHCPMFNNGSDWLSKQSQIKNPFYGNQMLTCGKTTETIK